MPLRNALHRTALDLRVWTLSALFVAWYAVGTVTPDANPLHVLAWPAFGLAFAYYATLGRLTLAGGPAVSWGGFFAFAALVVAGYDRGRRRVRRPGAVTGRTRPVPPYPRPAPLRDLRRL